MRNDDVTPFRIDIDPAHIDDLRTRLAATRWPVQVQRVGWSRGVPVDYLRELAAYWADGYDWWAQQDRLNAYPQFTTPIDGQRIHFLHVRSPHEHATPLLLLHGWPGSIAEFLWVIEPLTRPADPADAFHLVIPSHPNFGFTGPATEPGWSTHRIARAYAQLMQRLGYHRYGAQGGDFGTFIAPALGRLHPDRVIGVHVNAATADDFIPWRGVSDADLASLTDAERARLARMNDFLDDDNGYFHIQATRPHTLGYALADSPAGQLGWIVEKFAEWSHGGGPPEQALDRDQMLTNITIYWLTNTGASSAQLYYEAKHTQSPLIPSTVPTAVANFAEDFAIRRFGEPLNTIVRWTEFDRGGHFAAMEVPDLLVRDVQEFFRDLRATRSHAADTGRTARRVPA